MTTEHQRATSEEQGDPARGEVSATGPACDAGAHPDGCAPDGRADDGRGWKRGVTACGIVIAVAVILLSGRLWGAESVSNREADLAQTQRRIEAPDRGDVPGAGEPAESYDENGVKVAPAPAPAPSASADADADKKVPSDNSNILPTIVGGDEAAR
ncbi:MAG: hypothetical protein SOI26_03630 [Coriobacteriales bacterium]|jgi:hypothetical protein